MATVKNPESVLNRTRYAVEGRSPTKELQAMIRPQTCPICERELDLKQGSSPDLFPFCSERCRQVDLFRWSEGKYEIVEPLQHEGLDADEE